RSYGDWSSDVCSSDLPHPPAYAPHTFPGFSTGKYEGNILTVTTTHLKRGWIRANGAPQSDAATVTEHIIRHGDIVTVFAVVDDRSEERRVGKECRSVQ